MTTEGWGRSQKERNEMSNTLINASTNQFVPMDAIFPAEDGHVAGLMSVGERLRHARSKAGLTLDSAAARTRIRRDYLEALEHMDPRGLPSRAYTIGYLRTYAAFLRLDVGPIVDQFKQEVECETGRAQPTAPKQKVEIKLPRGVLGVAVILCCVIAAGAWYATQIGKQAELAETTARESVRVEAPKALVAELEEPIGVDQVWANLPNARSHRSLILRASAPTFVEVRDASGRILFSRDLQPGEAYRAPDEPGLTVLTENAGRVFAYAGGQSLGPLGEQGQAIENVSADTLLGRGTSTNTADAAYSGGL